MIVVVANVVVPVKEISKSKANNNNNNNKSRGKTNGPVCLRACVDIKAEMTKKIAMTTAGESSSRQNDTLCPQFHCRKVDQSIGIK